ncbi:AfsR/SARP family transcriptional regulator [Actinoplanes aureus]|uniref:Tetratricopeptide repeat protein n=1 Tax=Actinoplanes aureus TaxID=2792083 RepID=A0A931CE71_9ACTN|nr:BTAD domain-containing putative transcriptional regulator [Actinoplanes aureus]MBG0565837.1 tetratricopeptide repeat protein [Actinoplanes aureus]
MEFRLLGPVEARTAAGPVDIGQPRQRAVLAALLVDAGRPVPMDVLIDRVWGERPPAKARHAVQAYVSALRRALSDGPVELHRAGGGYRIDVPADLVDLRRFENLAARDEPGPLGQALGLWRGSPVADLPGPWAQRLRRQWHNRRIEVALAWARAASAAGTAGLTLDALSALCEEYPLVEPLAAALIRALHECGRTSEALDRYASTRHLLAEELGTDPGRELHDVYRMLLTASGEPGDRSVEFRLLGPVEVGTRAGVLPLGGAKIRTLLATLLLPAGRVISTDRLIDVIWDDDPPPTARALVQTYVSALRRALPADVIETRPPGYLARIDPDSLDRNRFDALVARGRAAAREGRHGEASETLRAAAALWRGPALGGVRSTALAAEAARLDEQRLTVTEERISADLALGRADQLCGELSVLVGQHPTRESLRALLMTALYRSGRAADALAVYRQGRAILVEELGIEPGPELARLHEAILRGDAGPAPVAAAPAPVPAQLPPDAADFTGREAQSGQLIQLLESPSAVGVIAGPGGVGKSALAVHVAHRVASAYPGGVLHVDLRGMSASPASPAEVLGRFLRAFDVDPSAIESSLDERMNQYRSLLAGRRVLVVLDDAANEQQVRPLLPGSPRCGVLITSRNRLPGLAGARLLELDMLSRREATALLARVVGDDRVISSPDAAAEIVTSCGRLPLAVRIAGARLATRRHWSAQLLARRLGDERRRLDELWAGDQQVRATIEMSLPGLDPRARVALRRLGQLGPADFPCWVVAALLDTSADDAETVVEQLVDAHLVDYTYVDHAGQIRYRLHDLVRIYAREQAERHESYADQVAVTTRVADGWLTRLDRLRGHIADRVTSGCIPLWLPSRDSPAGEPAGEPVADPRGWLDVEQTSLVLAVERAAALDLDDTAVRLASLVCASSYPLNNVIELWQRAHDAALGAARRAGNRLGEAVLVAALGQFRYEQDRYPEARRYLSEALALFRDLGHQRGAAATLTALGLACREQGHLPEARHFLEQAMTVCAVLDDDGAIGHCARIAGSVYLEQGAIDEANASLRRALDAYRRAGSRRGTALTLRTIGLVHRAAGRLGDAEQVLSEATDMFRRLGDVKLEGFSSRALAKTHVRMGQLDRALAVLEPLLVSDRHGRDRWAEAMTLRTLGELHLSADRLDEADACLRGALEAFRALEMPLFAARTLRDIAELREACGEHAAAAAARHEALATFRAYGAREVTELSSRVATESL